MVNRATCLLFVTSHTDGLAAIPYFCKKNKMVVLHTLLLAILVAFLGFSPPGMLNMTALKLSLENKPAYALSFAAGASFVIFFQSLIAVTFARFLGNNPEVVSFLKYGAIAVFLALAFFFYRQARSAQPFRLLEAGRKGFWAGMAMSAMNMLAIPFFLGYSTLLEAQDLLDLTPPLNIVFALGAMGGALGLFAVYIWFAAFIQRRVQFVARNINYILSLLFLLLALSAFYNALWGGR